MKHAESHTEPGQFRIVRAFSAAHNLRRLVRHCEGLLRTSEMQRWARTMRLRRRLGMGTQAARNSPAV
jgi:hypothetical protein